MQNKPNSPNVQIYINIYDTKDYQNFIPLAGYKNKPNQTQFKPKTNPISEMPKMNVSIYYTKGYKNFIPLAGYKNKPNSNPIQSQYKPNYRKDPKWT